MQRTDIIIASKGISLFLVSFSGSIVLISAIEQLFGMPVLGVNMLLGVVIAIALLRYLLKLHPRRMVLITGVSITIVIMATLLSGYFYDIFWDGNAYHKLAVGYLAKGWNATWHTVEEFLEACPFSEAAFLSRNPPWIDFFPKASWYYGAVFYKVFQNIETGKSINILMIAATFFAAFDGFLNLFPPRGYQTRRKIRNTYLYALVASAIAACNPISLNQLFSFYIDGLLGSIWCLTIISLFCESDSERYWLVIRFFLIIIGCNLKFTSGAIIGVFCVASYLIKVYTYLKEKKFTSIFRLTGYYIVCCLVAFGVVGSSSYVKNTLCYGHPFYPIMEKGNTEGQDVMAGYLPDEVAHLLPAQKWLLVTFSKTESARGDTDIHLKIPFSFEKQELLITHIDTERGGMGAFYSGLLLISLGYSASVYIRQRKLGAHGVLWLACLVTCFILVCIIDASWLARYSPYVYFPIMFAGIQMCARMVNENKKVVVRTAGFIFIGLTLLNSITFLYCVRGTIGETRKIHAIRNENAFLSCEIYLPIYEGPIFNFMDDKLLLERTLDTPNNLNEWYVSCGVYWHYIN